MGILTILGNGRRFAFMCTCLLIVSINFPINQKVKENVGRILLFGSTDDPFLPWSEQNEVSLSVTKSLHVQGVNAKYMTSTITTTETQS